jgi:two-component system sensor histidine kinase PilS (NtrC family)
LNLRARQPAPIRQGDPLHWRISVYILFRLVLASIFLILVAAQVIGGDQLSVGTNSYFYLEIATFLLMGISALGLRTVRSLQSLAYLQFIVDTVLITVLVTQTGGIRSLFTVLYFMTIVASAYLVYRRGSLIVAALNSAAFVVVAIVQPMTHLEPNQVLTSTSPSVSPLYAEVLTGVFGFFLVAILAGQLADKLRETGQALIEQEAQSRALQEALTQIANTIRGGLVIIGADQRLRSANPTALKLFPTLQDAPASESIPRFDSEQAVWEVQLQEEDQIRHVILSRSPLEDGGVVITMEDVTRLRGMERVMQREERQAAVGRLAAGIAHEIRNPLTSLSGAVQLLQPTSEDERLMAIIQREVQRLNQLVTDFMEAARPRTLDPKPTDLPSLVEAVVETFGHDQRYQGLVKVAVSTQPLDPVMVDPEQIRQVLWNLVLNAAQAMPGGGTIKVTLSRIGDRVRLMVTDEGSGIPAADLEKVFDPFYSRKTGGTGLGLATVDRVARDHGGEVWVRSEEGVGTTFAIWLPYKRSGEPEAREDRSG